MPTLAELLGGQSTTDVKLLQAKVVSVAAGSATIHFGTATDTVSGVRTLSGASFSAGDLVWVLRNGGVLIILGRLGPTTGSVGATATRLVFSPDTLDDQKLVFWQGGGTYSLGVRNAQLGYFVPSAAVHSFFVAGTEHARIDAGAVRAYGNIPFYFHTWGGGWFMSDATWVRSWADKGVHTGGLVGAGNARMGNSLGHGSDYAEFSHSSRMTAGGYSVLSAFDGNTYVNAAAGTSIWLRINNADRLIIQNDQIRTGGIAISTQGASYYTKAIFDNVHRMYWHSGWDGTVVVGYGRVQLQCSAQDHCCESVAQTRHVNIASTAWRYSDAAGHTNFSDPKGKKDMRPLDAEKHRGKLKTIKPIKFKFRKEMADPEGDRDHFGFSADELPPEVIHIREMADGRKDKLFNPAGVLALLWQICAEQDERDDALEQRIAALERRAPA